QARDYAARARAVNDRAADDERVQRANLLTLAAALGVTPSDHDLADAGRGVSYYDHATDLRRGYGDFRPNYRAETFRIQLDSIPLDLACQIATLLRATD